MRLWITPAYEKGLRIILDDRKAREVAQRLGVPVTDTVGLLLKAKQEGVVTAIRPLLDALASNQFRIADALRAKALRLAAAMNQELAFHGDANTT